MRKRIVIATGLLGVALVFAATPLLAMKRLRDGLEMRDPAAVAPLVDFQTLRANVKAAAHQKIERKNDGRLLEPLRDWIGLSIADDVLERVATPEGLIRLSCDKATDADLSGTRGKPCVLNGEVRHLRYLSLDRFRIDVATKDGQTVALVLSRRDIASWRLVDVIASGAGA